MTDRVTFLGFFHQAILGRVCIPRFLLVCNPAKLQRRILHTVTCSFLQNEMASDSSVVIFGCHVVNMEGDVVKKDTHVVKIAVLVVIVKLWEVLDSRHYVKFIHT
ncbi:hypothetical protein E2636_02675 [Paenisporosarcina antarctica]|uniref:Uncharacterized protein n=1 Tax=Paenisporosarcina antarctica TaxID=417367 RepID=A0A4P6ZUW2_9BACL|nr:hypothetical protein E2636_02675 [Paenisporosarcina antarctica]